jgi:hypothetical protein
MKDRYGHWIGIGWKCFVSFGIIFLTCLCINYHMVYLKLDAWILVGVTGVAFVLGYSYLFIYKNYINFIRAYSCP